MRSLSEEQVTERLGELRALLGAWYANRDSDSVWTQNFRAREYVVGERLLTGLIYDLPNEKKLQLTIGNVAIEGLDFSKNTRKSRRSLTSFNPGDTFGLEDVNDHYNFYYRPPKLERYFGDLTIAANLGLIASSVYNGGHIQAIELPELNQGSSKQ